MASAKPITAAIAEREPEPDWLATAQHITSLTTDTADGRHTALTDTYRIHKLLKSLSQGNYLQTAVLASGFAKDTPYDWKRRAERGEIPAIAITDALEKAQSWAEQDLVCNVKTASKLPQFWAAGMTLLERRHPEKWGKRSEDSGAPRVVVQIGARDSDVRVQIGESPARLLTTAQDTPAQVIDSVEVARVASDKQDYVNHDEDGPGAV